jgi:hypothetical protein
MIENIEQGTLAPNIKACIALTSWKKRINTVGLTIYNLFETCGPDYHIVLTLAEEEFPKKEQELPRDLVLMNKAGMFEILWCKRNVKSFKKWLPCSQKYSTVPVISADDDCIYVCNYANELYNMWLLNKHSIISFRKGNYMNHVTGPATLYAPKWFNVFMQDYRKYNPYEKTLFDDGFYDEVIARHRIPVIALYRYFPCIIHDEISPVSGGVHLHPEWGL